MVLEIKYNCGCEYSLDKGPEVVKVTLCNLHKGMLSPVVVKPKEEK